VLRLRTIERHGGRPGVARAVSRTVLALWGPILVIVAAVTAQAVGFFDGASSASGAIVISSDDHAARAGKDRLAERRTAPSEAGAPASFSAAGEKPARLPPGPWAPDATAADAVDDDERELDGPTKLRFVLFGAAMALLVVLWLASMLAALVDTERRTIHDRICRTRVVYDLA
jgi:hypothetical protein